MSIHDKFKEGAENLYQVLIQSNIPSNDGIFGCPEQFNLLDQTDKKIMIKTMMLMIIRSMGNLK